MVTCENCGEKEATMNFRLVLKRKFEPLIVERNFFCSNQCAAEWYNEVFVEHRTKDILEAIEEKH